MHICQDEIIAAATTATFIRYSWPWLVAKVREKCGIGCKHVEDIHDCESCEADFECETLEDGQC